MTEPKQYKISIEPQYEGFIVNIDRKKYPLKRGHFYAPETDKILAVETSLREHLNIKYSEIKWNSHFRCEVNLDEGIAKVYYPIILKITWHTPGRGY